MSFKDSAVEFQIVDVALLDPDLQHARRNIGEDTLKGLANSIQKLGIIHPLVVRPGSQAGRYTVVVGERRRQAAIIAELRRVPVLIRNCAADETLEVQVFENMGLGVRAALEPRDMANAIQSIAEKFASTDEAAQHFGRAPTWLSQATAAANLSEKVTALLDAGKISSTSAAVQLEKLAKRNEAKAESLIVQIEQLPEGEKVSKKVVDHALSEASGRVKKKEEAAVASPAPTLVAPTLVAPAVVAAEPEPAAFLPNDAAKAPGTAPAPLAARSRVNPGKVRRVAEILGLSDEDEEDILVRLIDEFLAMKNEHA